MESDKNIRAVQMKILEIMKYIDSLCRFIPWDDDLDIFMTPSEYAKFKDVFEKENSDKFILQEWRTTEKYLEYTLYL